jgi:HEAT repeat protein
LLVKVASRSPEARSRIERLAIERIAIKFPYVQAQIALILQEIGSSHDVLPELIEGTFDSQDHIRRDAILALKARHQSDPRVLPSLRAAMRNQDSYNAGLIARSLRAVESAAATPTLPGGDH